MMTDMQNCDVCGKKFDFDKEGLGCGPIVVCGAECGKKSAASRGNAHAIHDKTGAVTETNGTGDETRHIF